MHKREEIIDVLKGVLMVLVIFRHLLIYSVEDGGVISNIIWGVQMPGFFFISGYCGYKTYNKKGEAVRDIFNLFIRLLIPFLSWIFIVNFLVVGKYDRNLQKTVFDVLFHVDHALWFIWTLFIIRLLFIPINIIYSNKLSAVLKLISMLFYFVLCEGLLLLLGMKMGLGFLGIKFILYYGVCYLIGYCVRKYNSICFNIEQKIGDVLGFLFGLMGAILVWNIDLFSVSDNLVGILVRLVTAIMLFYVLLRVCRYWKDVLLKIHMAYFGRYTMELYVTHATLCAVFSVQAHDLFSINGSAAFLITSMWLIILTVLLIVILKSNKYTNLLFYGKCSFIEKQRDY